MSDKSIYLQIFYFFPLRIIDESYLSSFSLFFSLLHLLHYLLYFFTFLILFYCFFFFLLLVINVIVTHLLSLLFFFFFLLTCEPLFKRHNKIYIKKIFFWKMFCFYPLKIILKNNLSTRIFLSLFLQTLNVVLFAQKQSSDEPLFSFDLKIWFLDKYSVKKRLYFLHKVS